MRKVALRRLIILLSTALLLLTVFSAALAAAGDPQGWLTSTVAGVNIRSDMSTSSDIKGKITSAGTRVPYYARMKDWYYIRWNGIEGWVSGSNFTL